MAQNKPVLLHPCADLNRAIDIWERTVLEQPQMPDYSFEQRYIRGTPRPSYPERDEVCLHFNIIKSKTTR